MPTPVILSPRDQSSLIERRSFGELYPRGRIFIIYRVRKRGEDGWMDYARNLYTGKNKNYSHVTSCAEATCRNLEKRDTLRDYAFRVEVF